ncbi:MAG: nucleotidyltransferase domain-containing protein [Planctomycetota bacterium]
MSLGRGEILNALEGALRPLDFVHALWEGGSAAFGRADAYSDVDLHTIVDDEHVEELFARVDDTLAALSPIERRWRLSEPTWHGHSQCFYRLRDAGPYVLVDFVAMRRGGSAPIHDEVERHGEPQVVFDKAGLVRSGRVDRGALRAELEAGLAELGHKFEMIQPFVEKELLRDNPLGAMGFYLDHTLGPAHRMLRILYCPERHDFGLRYARVDLPADVAAELAELAFVRDADDLRTKCARAQRLFRDALAAVERNGVAL